MHKKAVIVVCLLLIAACGAVFFTALSRAVDSGRFNPRPAGREALIADCSLAVELDPRNAWAFARRGHLFLEGQNFEAARSDCLRALELGMETGGVLFDLISACVDLGDYETAERYCLRLPETPFSTDPEVYVLWGRILLGLGGGRHKEALEAFDRAGALGGQEDERVMSGRAEALAGLGRLEEALVVYERALELFPGDSCFGLEKANCLVRLGRKEEAFAVLDSIKDDPDSVLRVKIFACVNFGDFEQALSLSSSFLSANPGDTDVLLQRGNALHGLRRFDEAVADFDKVLSVRTDNAWIYLCRGSALVSAGADKRAIADFSRAIELAPDMIMPYIDRAGIYARQGQKNLALQDIEEAKRIDPLNPAIRKVELVLENPGGQTSGNPAEG